MSALPLNDGTSRTRAAAQTPPTRRATAALERGTSATTIIIIILLDGGALMDGYPHAAVSALITPPVDANANHSRWFLTQSKRPELPGFVSEA